VGDLIGSGPGPVRELLLCLIGVVGHGDMVGEDTELDTAESGSRSLTNPVDLTGDMVTRRDEVMGESLER